MRHFFKKWREKKEKSQFNSSLRIIKIIKNRSQKYVHEERGHVEFLGRGHSISWFHLHCIVHFCHQVTYCGQACQKLHWFTHKKVCKKLEEQREQQQAQSNQVTGWLTSVTKSPRPCTHLLILELNISHDSDQLFKKVMWRVLMSKLHNCQHSGQLLRSLEYRLCGIYTHHESVYPFELKWKFPFVLCGCVSEESEAVDEASESMKQLHVDANSQTASAHQWPPNECVHNKKKHHTSKTTWGSRGHFKSRCIYFVRCATLMPPSVFEWREKLDATRQNMYIVKYL